MEETPDGGTGPAGAAPELEASLALDGDPSCIAQARHLAAVVLIKAKERCGIPVVTATVEIVQLIVSELVTNALKHAPGPASLHLRTSGPLLRIELRDSTPHMPATRAPDPERIGQHGLEIVAALAETLTVEPTADGKRIVATLALDAPRA
ncbi:ATP-binding protein [Streptomyces sp. NPDC057094]|uniref:ATP-binding protein n=1 Tax=Streptomyces sp. NPDC057094 TaxID=3346018 RepID=UPI00363344B8